MASNEPPLPDVFETPPKGRVDLLIVAGEHSGDEHAASIVRRLKQNQPDLEIAALGGPQLQQAGAQLLYDLAELSVVGLVEVLKHASYFRRLFELTLGWIEQNQPKAVMFVDYPGFNLRLAQKLFDSKLSAKSGGPIKLLYYISPQIWAWKAKRRFKMAKLLDELAVIFPFEQECYKDTELKTVFVGHPFLQSKQPFDVHLDVTSYILLLPGSRVTPVRRIFPILLEAYTQYLKSGGKRPAAAIYPSRTIHNEMVAILDQYPEAASHVTLASNEGEVHAAAVLTSSGTMSLRCALAGVPGCIVYRAHPLTYFIGKKLVKIPYLGIANILLNKDYYPEFVQGQANAEVLSNHLHECLQDLERIDQAYLDSLTLKEMLGGEDTLKPWDWLTQHLLDSADT